MAASIVTIHHEGAGVPVDDPRGAKGGYTSWHGPSRWKRLRSVFTSFATKGYNHISHDACLSGDRTNIPVTDEEIAGIGEACADSRARGELVDFPTVKPHRASYGTACPGNMTMERFGWIIAACQASPTLPDAVWEALIKLSRWHESVRAEAIEYGDSGPRVRVLIDLLREKHLLRRGVFGNKYGRRVRTAVYKLKDRTPALADQSAPLKGERFGYEAATALLGLN